MIIKTEAGANIEFNQRIDSFKYDLKLSFIKKDTKPFYVATQLTRGELHLLKLELDNLLK